MSDIEMHYRFAKHWEENASKETWANKTVAWNIWQEKQAKIDELKTQLNNMEQCYIQLKQEHNELIAFNTEIDRKQKSAEKTTEKYKFKVSMIGDLLRDSTDQEMTLKAIRTVVDRVGEHA